jgi:YVTN family beta-propeller protein
MLREVHTLVIAPRFPTLELSFTRNVVDPYRSAQSIGRRSGKHWRAAWLVALLAAGATSVAAQSRDGLPGMPPLLDAQDVYAGARPGQFSAAVRGVPERVYVPNSGRNTVDVIDPHTFKIIDHFAVGRQPQHIVPSYDLKTLWVLNDLGDQLTHIDPMTGRVQRTIKVLDPYNMYYTPDGKYAIVVAERLRRLDFLDAQTMKLVESMSVPCRGVNHLDFSADGRYLIAACEFSGIVLKVDVTTRTVLGTTTLPKGAMPQDVRLAPDGRLFYIADMMAHGVHLVDGASFQIVGFLPTGKGTHGLYFSRDSKWLYVSNRDEGSVAVVDVKTRTVAQKWLIPGGGSPDMGGVSADGKVLWLSGRYHAEVYAFDTGDGRLLARIPVSKGPHGLCVYPQPGRYSLGHTGNMR